MMHSRESIQESTVYIYGTGSFGRDTLELCDQLGLEVEGFVDHIQNSKSSFKNFTNIEDMPKKENVTIILGVCNLFGDLKKISDLILSKNPLANILTPVQFAKMCEENGFVLDNYWLTGKTSSYPVVIRKLRILRTC